MPLAKIEVRKTWSSEKVQAIIEAVYLAQREALKVPEGDRQIRYIEHQPDHFHVPPGRTENYTLVEIALFAGRSFAAKCALYKAIIDNLAQVGIAANDIFIVLNEVPRDNWCLRGTPASGMDLGFKVEV